MHAMVRSLCAVSEYNYSLLLEVTQTNLQPHVLLLFFQKPLEDCDMCLSPSKFITPGTWSARRFPLSSTKAIVTVRCVVSSPASYLIEFKISAFIILAKTNGYRYMRLSPAKYSGKNTMMWSLPYASVGKSLSKRQNSTLGNHMVRSLSWIGMLSKFRPGSPDESSLRDKNALE
jgi:hypothetical protein